MKASLGSYALGWNALNPVSSLAPLAPIEFVELANSLGFPGVQFSDNLPLDALNREARLKLKRRATELGIFIEVGTRGLHEDQITTYLELATDLGSPFIRMVIDCPGYEPSPEEIIRFLRTQTSRLAKEGVVLAIENHDRFLSSELATIIEACESPFLGVCFDTANSFGAGEDPLTAISTLAKYTVNIHCKDVRIQRLPHQQGFTIEGTPFGDGQLPLELLISLLENRSSRSCHTMTLEHWIPPESSERETYEKALGWCTKSAETMRSLYPEALRLPACQ